MVKFYNYLQVLRMTSKDLCDKIFKDNKREYLNKMEVMRVWR